MAHIMPIDTVVSPGEEIGSNSDEFMWYLQLFQQFVRQYDPKHVPNKPYGLSICSILTTFHILGIWEAND